MPTAIIFPYASPDGDPGSSRRLVVREDFERVLDLVIPLSQAASALESRSQRTLTMLDGHRVFIANAPMSAPVEIHEWHDEG